MACHWLAALWEITLPLVCTGSVSMLSLMDHHCWLAYVLDLFAKLPMLNTFFCIMHADELFRCEVDSPPRLLPSLRCSAYILVVLHSMPAWWLPGTC